MIERRFLGWERSVLHSVADHLLAGAGAGSAVDLSGLLVVLPGARAGRRLKEILLDRTETGGLPLRPPEVATVGGLPERLYTPALPPPDPVLDHQAWTVAIDELDRESLGVLVPHSDGSSGVRSAPATLVRTLQTLHDEVAKASRDFQSVATVCRDGFAFNDERRWLVLARLQERYRTLLDGHRRMDQARARSRALTEGHVGSSLEIWIAGAPDLPPVVRGFLRALDPEQQVRILVGAPADLSDRFDAHGCVIPEAWAEATLDVPDAWVELAAGPGEQAAAVVRYLADFAGSVPVDEITVGVPDLEVVPYVIERLEERSVPFRDARGTPLGRTGGFRLLEALSRYLEEPDFEAVASLVRHPAFERSTLSLMARGRRELGELLDRYQAVHLQSSLDRRSLPSGGESASASLQQNVRALLDALADLLDPLSGERSLSAWAPRIGGFVAALFERGAKQRTRRENRELDVLANALVDVLSDFRALPPALDRPAPGARALRLALEQVRDIEVPPEATEAAIELVGWLELGLDDAREMVITGFNDPFVPDSVTSHPFLPHSLRERIGLLDNRGRWARDLLVLQTILATRDRVSLVAGRRTAVGDPLLPSRLLFAADEGTVARRVLRLLGDDGPESAGGGPPVGGGELEGADAPMGEDFRREAPAKEEPGDAIGGSGQASFGLPPEHVLSAQSPPGRIRVTAFRHLLSDPYKYALESVLGLSRIDDEAREMDGSVFGSLAHEVLARFGDGPVVGSRDAGQITGALAEILEEEARGRFGSRPLPAVRLQLDQLRTRLRALARWQAEWAGEGWVIRAVEVSPEGEGVPFEVDGEPILLRGKLDRIDQNVQTGHWCVLDYKTGDRATSPEKTHRTGRPPDRQWVDLQLPLYRLLAESIRVEGGDPLIPPEALGGLRVGYVLVPRELADVGASLAEWSETDYSEAEEAARRAVRLLRANHFVFDARNSTIRWNDPLAAVVGRGVLSLDGLPEEERITDV